MRDGQHTGVFTKKFSRVAPFVVIICFVKLIGVVPPRVKSWSSLNKRIILGFLSQYELWRKSRNTSNTTFIVLYFSLGGSHAHMQGHIKIFIICMNNELIHFCMQAQDTEIQGNYCAV